MIEELIKKKIIIFLEDEKRREKEREDIVKDPVLKNNGITKDYLQLVQNAIAEKNLEKAKQLRDELEMLILGIEDLAAKDRAAVLGVEVNNLIDLEEKIRKNKENFELKVKHAEKTEKGFFEAKKEGKNKEEIKKMFAKGISANANQPQNAFFTSKPDKITVVQKIITPEQPLPSSIPENSNQADTKTQTNINTQADTNPDQKVVNSQPIEISTPPVMIQSPSTPQEITAKLVEDPKKGFEKEFGRASFFIHEISSFLKENEWQNAKKEYNTAREVIESLPDCEDKDKLMNQLFADYHKIKEIEAEWKKQQEEKKKKEEEEKARIAEEERKKKEKELAIMEEKRKERIAESQKREIEHQMALHRMKEAAKNHVEKLAEEKKIEEEKAKELTPPNYNLRPKPISHHQAQQTLLEAKHEQVKMGGENTSRFIALAQEKLNHDRSLIKPLLNEEIDEKKFYNTKIRRNEKSPDLLYKKAVSKIYEGKKDEAKTLLQELIKVQPQNIAAQIRLKECES